MTFPGRFTLLLLAAGISLAGCVGPRVVTGMTSRGDKVKFIYTQAKMGETEKGAVMCTAAADGSLSGCQQITLNFKEE